MEALAAAAPEAFDDFYQREYHRLLAIARALCSSTGAAEDLLQDAFVDAYGRWDSLANPGGWMRRVIVNKSASLFRRRAVEARHLLLGVPPAHAADPADRAAGLDLWASVRALPTRQSQVIVLRYVDEASIEEIADVLDVGVNTVKTHLQRARHTLDRERQEQP